MCDRSLFIQTGTGARSRDGRVLGGIVRTEDYPYSAGELFPAAVRDAFFDVGFVRRGDVVDLEGQI
jgi:hypothetical protein